MDEGVEGDVVGFVAAGGDEAWGEDRGVGTVAGGEGGGKDPRFGGRGLFFLFLCR